MLSKLSFSDEDVAKICQDPFKNLKTVVDDLKVEVNKRKGKPTTVKVLSNEYSLRKNIFYLSKHPVDRAWEDRVSEEWKH